MSDMAAGDMEHLRATVLVLCDPARQSTHGAAALTAVNDWLRVQKFDVDGGETLDFDSDEFTRAFGAARDRSDLIVICGGTGLGAHDIVPQTLEKLCDFTIPGIGEMLRAGSLKHSLNSYVSRCGGYVSRERLVVSIPGNPKAAVEQLEILKPLLPHAIDSVKGRCKSRRKVQD